MSYPRDLDEYTGVELEQEIARRKQARAAGLCDYCGRELNCAGSCKFPKRHMAEPLAAPNSERPE